MATYVAQTQDELDAHLAVATVRDSVELRGVGAFAFFSTPAPWIVTYGSSAPQISTYDSSAPVIVTYGSSAPQIDTYGSSAPRIDGVTP
jgi:hypothetical protein